MNGTPTPGQRAAAEALVRRLAEALAAADWIASPAPAGWEDGSNVR